MSPRHLALLLALGAVWGASFLFIKVVVEETSPITLVEARLFFGALAALAVVAWRRLPLTREPAFLLKVALLAALNSVLPFLLISWAEIHIASGLTAVLNSSTPLFAALFTAAFLPQEGLPLTGLVGLLVGFVGVVILMGGDILSITEADTLGQLAVIGASACYGLSTVFGRYLLRRENPMSLAGLQLALGVLLLAPALLVADGGRPDLALSAEAWASLLALGLLGTGIAYMVYLVLLDATGPVQASLVTYIIPIMALFLGWAVLDESIGLNTLLGCAFIIAGVAAVAWGRDKVARPAPLYRAGEVMPLAALGREAGDAHFREIGT